MKYARAVAFLAGLLTVGCSADEAPGDPVDAQAADAREPGDGGPDGAGSVDTGPPGDAAPPFTFHFVDLNHVLCTGQSLSVGAVGTPALSTTQPFDNRMFNTGVLAGGTNLTSLLPLVEQGVETMSSSMANLVSELAEKQVFVGEPAGRRSHRVLVSCHGIGGTPYAGLKKGTTAYANGIAQATAGAALAKAGGLSFVVRVVTNVHGESDHIAKNTAYKDNLVEWQADYERDVRAITGQAEPIPMLQTQMSSFTAFGQTTSAIPQAQLDAHTSNPGKIVLVGPKYAIAYATDGVHLTNEGYRHMGEYYAKVYRHAILQGRAWEPVRPRTATLSGSEIRVDFFVPAPPLVFDTSLVSAVANQGFEYADDSKAPPKITAVALDGPTTVKITLAAAPTGANRRVRYAFTGTANAHAGPTTGPRGNLRDSDPSPSRFGYKLYNWAVHFDQPL